MHAPPTSRRHLWTPTALLCALLLTGASLGCSSTRVETLPDQDERDAMSDTAERDVASSDTAADRDSSAPSDVASDAPSDTLQGEDANTPDTPRDAPVSEDTATRDTRADAAPDTAPAPDATPDADPPCPLGELCNPIVVSALPYSDTRDTRQATDGAFDAYGCAPDTDEGGRAYVYEVRIEARGVLTASVNDTSGDGVDVDVHLLSALEADACLDRDNRAVTRLLEPGVYYVVVDSWVNRDGDALEGAYTLDLAWAPLPTGACAMERRDLKMFWGSCDGVLDCFEAPDPEDTDTLRRYLRTPALGPVVLEAHLVTEGETFPNTWPSSSRDQIERHYQRSEQASGYSMTRTQDWAPAGEGGSRFGQGSTGAPVPVLDEAWYVNMYWRDRPARGTRLIVFNPANGRAVVASGGYETGPGANTAVGGASEEIHDHLGTGHRDPLIFGFAVDQDLPLGPIECPDE